MNLSVNETKVQKGQLNVTELQHASDSDSRSSTPVSGGSSGRTSPAGIDVDVLPVTYEPVKRVSAVRQRTKPVTTRSGLCNNVVS